jgi:hypothetical protein
VSFLGSWQNNLLPTTKRETHGKKNWLVVKQLFAISLKAGSQQNVYLLLACPTTNSHFCRELNLRSQQIPIFIGRRQNAIFHLNLYSFFK